MRIRGLELAGVAAARVGGGELATAGAHRRRLVELAPLREAYRPPMEIHAARGNRAEAPLAYDELRHRLRESSARPVGGDCRGASPAPHLTGFCETSTDEVAVVGHVESIRFARVERLPGAG